LFGKLERHTEKKALEAKTQAKARIHVLYSIGSEAQRENQRGLLGTALVKEYIPGHIVKFQAHTE